MPSTKKAIRKHSAGRRYAAAAVAALLVALCHWALPAAGAQVSTGAPIKLKIKTPKPKLDSFRGEVLNFTPSAITVRDRENMALIRTFGFSPELTRKLENRRMEGGRRVTVRFIRGSDTAVELKGQLSKAESDHPLYPRR